MNARNPKYNDNGSIDLEIEHPDYGWIPFTSASCGDALAAEMFARAESGEFGAIVPAPVVPLPVPAEVSVFQGCAALQQAGLLDEVEAYFAASTDPFEQLAWQKMTAFRRDSPLAASVGALFGLTAAQIDDLFRFAATIKT